MDYNTMSGGGGISNGRTIADNGKDNDERKPRATPSREWFGFPGAFRDDVATSSAAFGTFGRAPRTSSNEPVHPWVPPPRVPENAAPNPHDPFHSNKSSAELGPSLVRQWEPLFEEERAHLEHFQRRARVVFQEELTQTLDHHRKLWELERGHMRADVEYLNKQVATLGDENIRLKDKISMLEQARGGEPIIHHGSFLGNTPLVDGSPPSPVAGRQSGGTRWRNFVADDANQMSNTTGFYTNLLGFESPTGFEMPPVRSPSPQIPVDSPSPSRRVSISPPPGHNTVPVSPTFSPYCSSPLPRSEVGTPSASASEPVRSPKRPLSIIDAHELDPELDGISLRASAVRKPTFEEAPSDGSPPNKRQRGLSLDYCIVANTDEEDEDEDVKMSEEEAEEERRLTMHAGYTPNHLPSPRLAATSGPSQGSPTPTIGSLVPGSDDCLERESRSASLQATVEDAEESNVSYPDHYDHLRRVDSASSDSCSQGALSEASGDTPLKGPLMIRNNADQDGLFLAALNEKLEPISQGQDALPRVVQTPVAMPASLSAVLGEPHSDADAKQTKAPDDTDASGAQSDADEEHGGTSIEMEAALPLATNVEDEERAVRDTLGQPAIRFKLPGGPAFAHDGTPFEADPFKAEPSKAEPSQPVFFYMSEDDEGVPAKAGTSAAVPILIDHSDDDSDAGGSEPEVAIKFKSTSNFGAPFGRV